MTGVRGLPQAVVQLAAACPYPPPQSQEQVLQMLRWLLRRVKPEDLALVSRQRFQQLGTADRAPHHASAQARRNRRLESEVLRRLGEFGNADENVQNQLQKAGEPLVFIIVPARFEARLRFSYAIECPIRGHKYWVDQVLIHITKEIIAFSLDADPQFGFCSTFFIGCTGGRGVLVPRIESSRRSISSASA